jgi:hypothetical protein
LSVISFFILLPVVLLFSFGYKVDLSKFRVAKAGLIYLKTTPEGAKVYLNGRSLAKTTPVTIESVMPGEYSVSVELESYYPWRQKVTVEPGNATYLDNIILFPKNPYLDKVNMLDVGNYFIFSTDKDYAYCVSYERNALFKVRLDPQAQEETLLADNLTFPSGLKDLALSPDKKKILFFYDNRLNVIYLSSEKETYKDMIARNFFITADDRILYGFWYSDSDRLVVITGKSIRVYELLTQGKNNTTLIPDLHDSHLKAFYDVSNDILYFADIQKGSDDKWHRGLYRLDIGNKSLLSFIKSIGDNLK